MTAFIVLFSLIPLAIFTGNFYLLALVVLVAGIIYVHQNYAYRKTSYYKATRRSLYSLWHDKGAYGEYLIYKELSSYEEDNAKFLFNLYVPKNDGETAEIDLIMISHKGIFVYESKNYAGWIFGNENQRNWTQVLAYGKRKEYFYNPIKQNSNHIKCLNAYLGEEYPTHSVVVFSDRSTLKNVLVINPVNHICYRKQVGLMTDNISSRVSSSMTDEEIQKIYERLMKLTGISDEEKIKHNEDIKEHYAPINMERNPEYSESDSANMEVRRCPLCGGELVLRTAHRGKNAGKGFWGCSNYPHCHFIQEIIQ